MLDNRLLNKLTMMQKLKLWNELYILKPLPRGVGSSGSRVKSCGLSRPSCSGSS